MIQSVTRFGKIVPVWLFFEVFANFYKALFDIWQNFDQKVSMGIFEFL